MPIYEYRCPECGHEFEKLQKISAPAPACPNCSFAEVKKKVSASAFVLKGSGWYRDHYGLKSSKSADASGSDSGGSSDGGGSSSSDSTSSSSSTDS